LGRSEEYFEREVKVKIKEVIKMEIEKEEKEMKELMERIVGLGMEFGIMDRVKEGVRDWSWMVGVKVEKVEEFIKRVVLGCSLNFNYVEGGIEGLCSEVLWSWVRKGIFDIRDLDKFNLVEKRKEMFEKCERWLWKYLWYNGEWSILRYVVKEEWFWDELKVVYGGDVVSKRVNLVRMILKESGIEIWGMDRKEVVVDYNIMCVMKYLGVIDYEGDFKDNKEYVDEVRKRVYVIVEKLIDVSGKDESWLDGLMFFIGRELRKRGLVNVCLYWGCIDY